MAKNEWRRRIAVGSPVALDGVSYMVDAMSGEWVTLRALDGKLSRMQLRELAKRITSDYAPPPLSERFQDVEHRLSKAQVEKLDERRALVRWFESGLRPEQRGDATPDPGKGDDLGGRAARSAIGRTAQGREAQRDRGARPRVPSGQRLPIHVRMSICSETGVSL